MAHHTRRRRVSACGDSSCQYSLNHLQYNIETLSLGSGREELLLVWKYYSIETLSHGPLGSGWDKMIVTLKINCKISNISCTESQNSNVCLSLQLSLHNILKPGVNTLRPRQYCRHFADDIFNCIFMNENVWILIKISLKFVPKFQINNIPALVQIMAWRRPGDKRLSEQMVVCFTDAYMRHPTSMS